MTEDTRNNGSETGRDEGGRFQPGNPGRPKGARHKATLAAEALLDGEAEGLTRKCVEAALGGDMAALRICMDRILPPAKSDRSASRCRRSSRPKMPQRRWRRLPRRSLRAN